MKCWNCGRNATTTRNLKIPAAHYGEWVYMKDVPNEHQRNYCEECYKKHMAQLAEENNQYLLLKRKRMFEKAVSNLEHQKLDFESYKEAIKTIEAYNLENPDKFDSSYEIMAAIELIQNEIHIKPQYKVGSYQVDFLLPDYHVVLEIDGALHKTKKENDKWRDISIRNQLGTDWEVVRISTECLDMNITKLITAIEKVLEYREQHQ